MENRNDRPEAAMMADTADMIELCRAVLAAKEALEKRDYILPADHTPDDLIWQRVLALNTGWTEEQCEAAGEAAEGLGLIDYGTSDALPFVTAAGYALLGALKIITFWHPYWPGVEYADAATARYD
jgi:hypothetical protein